MINSAFMIKYTNALYSTPAEFSPSYNEFRDMFSSGQLKSKEWLIKELHNTPLTLSNKSYLIAGSWFGTLGELLLCGMSMKELTLLDIDPRCEKFLHQLHWNNPVVKLVTGDMYTHTYTQDIIINTSCEHIPDLREWLNLIPKGKIVVLQSNNYRIEEHISCVDSVAELADIAKLDSVQYAGTLETPAFTRYMLIGKT